MKARRLAALTRARIRPVLTFTWLIALLLGGSQSAAQFRPIEGSEGQGRSASIYYPPTRLPDGRVFILDFGRTATLYDPATRLFRSLGQTTVEHPLGAQATALADGRVLVTGGGTNPEFVPTAHLWTPGANSFEQVSNMHHGRRFHASVLLPNGQVLLVGGEGSSSTWEIFDPSTKAFNSAGTLLVEMNQPFAALLPDGRVFLGGGQTLFYDPTGGVFALGPILERPAFAALTVMNDGLILVTGGAVVEGGKWVGLNEARLFDPNTGQSIALPPMRDARLRHSATLLNSGKVLIAGGAQMCPGNCIPINSAEIFDPASRTFTRIDPMKFARTDHVPVRLLTGEVLFSGGICGSSCQPAPELYIGEGSQSPCPVSAQSLCLHDGHFAVELVASDPRTGATAIGRVIQQEGVFGYFSLPGLTGNVNNAEVFVKILDGRTITNHWWVFYAGLTDLEFWLTVRDVDSGLEKTYRKEPYTFGASGDTSAFP